jgi:long-subunit fatty acid transport protein
MPRSRAVVLAMGFAALSGAAARAQEEPPPQQQEQQKQLVSVGASSLLSASVGAGARALGMGGAFIAIADDATAAAWNPAGLSVLEKTEASIVWSPSIRLRTRFPITVTRDELTFLEGGEITSVFRDERFSDPSALTQSGREIDFASVARGFKLRDLKVVPQISFQRAVPLGLDSSVIETFRDRDFFAFRDAEGLLESSEFEDEQREKESLSRVAGGVDIYAVSVGLGFSQRASVGFTLNVWRGRIHGPLSTREHFIGEDAGESGLGRFFDVTESDLDDRYRGVNIAAGALFRPSDRWRIGLVYKAPFSMKRQVTLRSEEFLEFDGERSDFDSPRFQEVTEEGRIAWPETLGVGVAFLPIQALTLSTDFTQTGWGNASYQFSSRIETEERNIDGVSERTTLEGVVLAKFPSLYSGSEELVDDRFDQVDTRQLRMGAEYVVRGLRFAKLQVVPLRAGVFFEQPSVKDSVRNGTVRLTGLTAGAGLSWSHLSLDFAYVRVRGSFFSRDRLLQATTGTRFQTRTLEEVRSEGPDRFTSHRFVISAIIKP